IMFFAGALSGILGIGSGVLKVLALDRVMGLPFKVSTTTSNFMIGVTAAASAGLYLRSGYIDPVLTLPTVVGVTFGSLIGSRLLPHIQTKVLRRIFIVLILATAIQMIVGEYG
ncbi:MAG: sulfite exporter TauE/SafE family protein, partial [Parachlamydiaceae bacterium]